MKMWRSVTPTRGEIAVCLGGEAPKVEGGLYLIYVRTYGNFTPLIYLGRKLQIDVGTIGYLFIDPSMDGWFLCVGN